MDLNDLLYRHQIELMRADEAASLDAQLAHERLADLFAFQIAEVQREKRAPTATVAKPRPPDEGVNPAASR